MIIKSLGRKAGQGTGGVSRSFGKLLRYMNRGIEEEDGKAVLWHHIEGGQYLSEAELQREFERNAAHLKKHSRGNVLYHEILSFSAEYLKQLDHTDRAAAMRDIEERVAAIGYDYVRRRAPEQMAYGVIHRETDHLHLHLLISANAVENSKREWFTKAEFAQIQRDTEAYVLREHSQLGQTPIYDRDPNTHRERLKSEVHEQAMKARTREPSRKDTIKIRLHNLFEMAGNRQALDDLLRTEKLSFYTRGKNQGIIETLEDGTTRKHRLATLGLAEHYGKTVKRFELLETGKNKTQENQASPTKDLNEKSPPHAYTDDILKRANDREQAKTKSNTPPPADRSSDRGDDHER
jgi:hypothetical protein